LAFLRPHLTGTQSDYIFTKIEAIWKGGEAWPDFVEVMRRALYGGQAENRQLNSRSSQWTWLPGLCCQAAGGNFYWADYLAAAWILFYTGAGIMDSIEDQDRLGVHWGDMGPGVALNAASGLFFSAALALECLRSEEDNPLAAPEVIRYFHQSFLRMCSGQHRDLLRPEPTLEQYWKTAAAKSGVFFALACRGGARLATDCPQKLDNYYQFGEQVGILVQIMDDLEEVRRPDSELHKVLKPDIGRSLPVVYAREVLPEPERQGLRACLGSAWQDPVRARQALDLIDHSGAVLYTLTEIEAHRERALAALQETSPQQEAGKLLVSMVTELAPRL